MKVAQDPEGIYVWLQFKDSDTDEEQIKFTAFRDIITAGSAGRAIASVGDLSGVQLCGNGMIGTAFAQCSMWRDLAVESSCGLANVIEHPSNLLVHAFPSVLTDKLAPSAGLTRI
ncbi:hypothetical protein NM208_g985 [Fusarium decemcellulare]|uniref:Uncharacterized protein n=1 Tax=Fusarium decemcellulare TaxID=57161 RepID=A0ACC1SXX9_9HYPO|nr:hypothetical protein NM208_g985 [Fusarium decemcellulare]